MPRVSKEIQAIIEKHKKTFDKAPNFNVWARRFLTVKKGVAGAKDSDGNYGMKNVMSWRCDQTTLNKFEKAFDLHRNPPKKEESEAQSDE